MNILDLHKSISELSISQWLPSFWVVYISVMAKFLSYHISVMIKFLSCLYLSDDQVSELSISQWWSSFWVVISQWWSSFHLQNYCAFFSKESANFCFLWATFLREKIPLCAIIRKHAMISHNIALFHYSSLLRNLAGKKSLKGWLKV